MSGRRIRVRLHYDAPPVPTRSTPPAQAETPPVGPPELREFLGPKSRRLEWLARRTDFSWWRAYMAVTLARWAYSSLPAMPAELLAAAGLDYAYYRSHQAGPGMRLHWWHARLNDHHFLIVRGTDEPSQWGWYVANYGWVDLGAPLGRHLHFVEVLAQVVAAYAVSKVPEGAFVSCIGHSMGGMVSARVAELLDAQGYQLDDCWTFGNPLYVDEVHRHYWRHMPLYDVRNEIDLIARVPGIVGVAGLRLDWAISRFVPPLPVPVTQGRRAMIGPPMTARKKALALREQSQWLTNAALDFTESIRAHYSTLYAEGIWRMLRPEEREALSELDRINLAVDGFTH